MKYNPGKLQNEQNMQIHPSILLTKSLLAATHPHPKSTTTLESSLSSLENSIVHFNNRKFAYFSLRLLSTFKDEKNYLIFVDKSRSSLLTKVNNSNQNTRKIMQNKDHLIFTTFLFDNKTIFPSLFFLQVPPCR